MDTEWWRFFDPREWIAVIAMYLFLALFLIARSHAVSILIRTYLGRARDADTSLAVPECPPAETTAPRPACGARIPTDRGYCEWCGNRKGLPSRKLEVRSTLEQTEQRPLGLGTLTNATESANPVSAFDPTVDLGIPTGATKEGHPTSVLAKAPLGRRYLAYFVDTVIALGPALSGFALLIVALSVFDRSRWLGYAATLLMLPAYLLMFVGLLWFLVYFLLKDAWQNGPSLGKRLFRLMVVDVTTNKPCTRRQSIIRAIGHVLPLTQALDPLLMLQDPAGRRVGDHLAGTQVIAAEWLSPRP